MSTVRSLPSASDSLRLYKKIISDVLSETQPRSYADVIEGVKCRCARLRIPYVHGQIQDAANAMAERIERALAAGRPKPPAATPDKDRPLTRTEASTILQQLKQRYPEQFAKPMKPMKPMPKPGPLVSVAHMRLHQQLLQGIGEQVKRCEAAEANQNQEGKATDGSDGQTPTTDIG